MKYKIYTTSEKAWDGMIEAIRGAQKSIFLEMYIFLDDTKVTHDFFGAIKERLGAGVKVVIIADAYGSLDLKKEAVTELRTAGAEFMFFSHLLRRTHRKILIVDEKIAFLGGVNINQKIIAWNDLQIRLQGRIVKPLLKTFSYGYKMCGGHDQEILKYQKNSLIKKIKSWVVDDWPNKDTAYLKDYYRQKIIEAKEVVTIVTPYLIPPRWLMALLDNAVQRGVRVEFVIPKFTDIIFIDRVNYYYAAKLSELGVIFYFLPEMNHAKIFMVDNQEAMVGSSNFDVLSIGLNVESGVFFTQKAIINDLLKIINRWKSSAIHFDLKKRPLNFVDFLAKVTLKLFYPFL
ncbi:MAG: phosphatidylserine/phosphatidylglycerophosphate/cardiolipin synthase family protein [Candidatus Falkowbacteria bacterium]|nr:phosphatidylserine/phosphatidylglycerophosphate/cardiolipin synthase family protein [Candidatus Falkowbacteria bacterium]